MKLMFFLGSSALLCLSLTAEAARLRSRAAEALKGYDYTEHGTDWIEGRCSGRERQSPIDFAPIMLNVPSTGNFSYQYQAQKSSFEVQNNGHTLAADFAGSGLGGITYNGHWYNLLNVNIHAASEHTFGHLHYPLELHMVHKKFDGAEFLVLALPVRSASLSLNAVMTLLQETSRLSAAEEDEPRQPPPQTAKTEQVFAKEVPQALAVQERRAAAGRVQAEAGASKTAQPAVLPYVPPSLFDPFFNLQLQFFLKARPPKMNQRVMATVNQFVPLELGKLVEGGSYLEYQGSLTAPPCAEIATWLVRREPLLASDAQVIMLHQALYQLSAGFGNFRSVMPVNGRPVLVKTAVKEEPPPLVTPPPGYSFPTPGPDTSRDGRAKQWAVQATKIAKASTDYMANLDERLRKAATAHAEVITRDGPLSETAAAPPPPAPPNKLMDMAGTASQIAQELGREKDAAISEKVAQIAGEKQAEALRKSAEAAAAAGPAPAPAPP